MYVSLLVRTHRRKLVSQLSQTIGVRHERVDNLFIDGDDRALSRNSKNMMKEISWVCSPMWSPEEQDASSRVEDCAKRRPRLCPHLGLSQSLLDNNSSETMRDEEDRPMPCVRIAPTSFEGG
jgi:hypothetical protein